MLDPRPHELAAQALEKLKQLQSECGKIRGALVAFNTQKGYSFDWNRFVRWCESVALNAWPADPQTVSLYIAGRLSEGRKVSTIVREVSAISQRHVTAGIPSPLTDEVRSLLKGARRLRGNELHQVKPLTLENLRAMSVALAEKNTLRSCRDRAIIVVGFTGALRSANLAALLLDDVEFTDRGVILRIRRSKTDQEGNGRLIGLPRGEHPETCPEVAIRCWLTRRGTFAGPLFTPVHGRARAGIARGIESGTVFLEPERINGIVKAALRLIGIEPKPTEYGSHSLRAGFVTEAGENGASELLIAAQTGHRNLATLRRYFRRSDVFKANACSMLKL